MSKSRLFLENGRAHFMTKRFDRENTNTKHHMQTLCAMNHIDYKKKSTNGCEQLFMTARELSLGHQAEVEIFRRMVFNVMGRNCDDHSKNFSFLLRKNSAWELAPAYDITFAYNPIGEWTNQHLMSVNGKYKNFIKNDFLAVADRFSIGEAHSIINEVEDAIKSWPIIAKTVGIEKREIEQIEKSHLFF